MRLEFAYPLALLLFVLLGAASILLSRVSRTYLPPHRRRLSLAVRLLLLALVALGLAQPRLSVPQNSLNVVFLVDASDSVGPAGEDQATQWIRQALAHLGPKDRAGVVVFGKDALVESTLAHSSQLPDLASAPVRSATDIAGAIRLGMALVAGNGGKRLILLSDGQENLGAAQDEARIAALSGVEISVVPVVRPAHPNVYVDRLNAPATVRKNERFDVQGSIQSTVSGSGTLYLFTDGKLTSQQDITLHPGANAFSFAHDPAGQGFHTFSVHLETSADATPENKQASSFAYISGEPRVLVVEGQPQNGTDLVKALQAQGMQVDRTAPTGIPSDLAQLRSFDSVVLVNVPLSDLPVALLGTLKLYVQNLGGGLVTVGGDKSYASGQYARTPLDDMLPVSSEVTPRKNLPSTAVVFIIESLENNLGIDISKEAAKSAIGYLSSADEVAVNDTSGGWVVPLQHVGDKAAISSKIDAMSPSDPASYATALHDAQQALGASQAKTKHIILMGDGDASDTYQPLAEAIVASGITISVVGTNVQPSDLSVLQDLARWGKGRYYDGNDPFDIPQLLVKETQLVARPAIVEGTFKLSATSGSPILRSIAPDSLPALRGYVATTPKPTAQVVLSSSEQDPILAQWQYGLGHVVSWTSDAGGRWAQAWVSWPQYATFWSQLVRQSLPSNVDQDLQVNVAGSPQGAHITVDAVAPDKSYRNFLTTQATVVSPGAAQSTVTLHQTSPGRYEGDFPTPDQGTYLIQVVQTDAHGQVLGFQPTGYAIDYSPEYRDSGTNTALVQQLTQLTQGRALSEPAQAFNHDLRSSTGRIIFWPWLLLLALFLFLGDVAIRRLRLSRRDLALLWSRLGARAHEPAPEGRLAGLRLRVQETRAQGHPAARPERTLAARLGRGASGRAQPAVDATVVTIAARLQQQRLQRESGPAAATGTRDPAPSPLVTARQRPASAAEAAAVAARRATPLRDSAAAPAPPTPLRGSADSANATRSRLLAAKQRARKGEE